MPAALGPGCAENDRGPCLHADPFRRNFWVSGLGDAWMAQSVKHPTLDFGSGQDLMVLWIRALPRALCWWRGACLGFSLSFSLCPSPSLAVSVSLKINKCKTKKKKKRTSGCLDWASMLALAGPGLRPSHDGHICPTVLSVLPMAGDMAKAGFGSRLAHI